MASAQPLMAMSFQRVQKCLVVVMFVSLFFALTMPAFDSDFWWHLASGRWIWENRALLRKDPFDFTSAIFAGSSPQVSYQLTQYWLAQVLMYGAYLLAGLQGVVLLRAAVFTALFCLLYRLLRRTGTGTLPCVLLLALAVQAIVWDFVYIAARPQMWSSLFFVELLLILENLRGGRRWAQFALPSLMLLWANLHGGYILGVIVIAIAAAEAHLVRHEERRRILLVALVSIVLTGVNPSGYEALVSYPRMRIVSLSAIKPGIFEEDSLFRYVRVASLPRLMPGLTAILLLPFLTLLPRVKSLLRERRDHVLIFLLVLGLGVKAQRFLIFLVPTACWMAAINLAALRERPWGQQRPASRLFPPWVLGALTVTALGSLTTAYALRAAQTSALRSAADYHHEIEGAADYLKHSGFKGNIFNDYDNGGYLAWRLYPETKVFIYGRMVYPELLELYAEVIDRPTKTSSLSSSGDESYFYQKIFDNYSIDAVIIPAAVGRTGDVIPLTTRLAWDDDWALVYARPEALVFLRMIPALVPRIGRALPKSEVFENQIAVARAAAQTRHGRYSPVWRRSLVIAYYGLGRKEESLRILDEYLALTPDDTEGRKMRDRIAREVGGKLQERR